MGDNDNMQENTGKRAIAIGFWMIIFTFMCAGIVTLLTRQILVKRLHIDNDIVHFIYSGNRTLLDEAAIISGNRVIKPIDWKSIYPFCDTDDLDNSVVGSDYSDESTSKKTVGKIEQYKQMIESVKSDVSNYANNYHPWQLYMKWLSGGYDRLIMGQTATLASGSMYIACGDWLYEYSDTNYEDYSNEDIEELADKVADFNEYLDENDIVFLYASASTKPCPYDNDLLTPNNRGGIYSNRRRFLKALDLRGVPYCDFSEMMPHEALQWYGLYYKTDNHWNDTGGLWASRVLADYLNENSDFSFNSKSFDLDSYTEDKRSDYFRGSMARNLSPIVWDKETLTRYIPRFETNYTITHYSEEGVETRKGKLEDVFFNNDVYNSLGTTSEKDIYDGTNGDHRFIENDDLYTIINVAAPDNRDKKILILRDSFTTYVAPYLSTDVGELDLVYMPKFTGSIRAYIAKNKPDAVIMLLYEDNIAPESAQSGGKGYHFNLR